MIAEKSTQIASRTLVLQRKPFAVELLFCLACIWHIKSYHKWIFFLCSRTSRTRNILFTNWLI